MFDQSEKFNAFSNNRLIKKKDNIEIGANRKLVVSPMKSAFFLFNHLLNRTVTSTPWIFWISLIITFVQIICSVFLPFHEFHWSEISSMQGFNYVLSCIMGFYPPGSSNLVIGILFGVYSLAIISHFILFWVIIAHMKRKKDVNIAMQIFFYYSYLVMPIMRCSYTLIISHELAMFARNPTFATFFLSLFALIILALHLFMTGVCQFMMGSSPCPNTANPLAIWGPCAWKSVIFEVYVCFIFCFIELTRNAKGTVFAVLMTCIALLVMLPHAIFQSLRTYYISFIAYEYIGAVNWGMFVMMFLHILIHFSPSSFVLWKIVIIAFSIISGCFIIMWVQVNVRMAKVHQRLDKCGTPTTEIGNEHEDDLGEKPLYSSVYDTLELKNAREALFAVRCACLTNHTAFTDLSLVQYCSDKFPSMVFELMHLTFLLQTQGLYVQQLIDLYLEENKPGILQSAVLFQIITSMQESSNDLPQALVRELGRQKLQAMKCDQLLVKFWTSCYKADVSQMSRQAFALNKHISDLANNWRMLILRYPFSVPVLKDYIHFLSSTGKQHKIVDAIVSNHPALSDVTVTLSTATNGNELNITFLHQAVEDSVDRRPISSIKKLDTALASTVVLAAVFFIAVLAVGFTFVSKFNTYNDLIYQVNYYCTMISFAPNQYDDIRFASGDTVTQMRSHMYEIGARTGNALNRLLDTMPDHVLNMMSQDKYSLYVELDQFQSKYDWNFVGILRLCSYYIMSMAYSPDEDPLIHQLTGNLLKAISMVVSATKNSIDEIESVMNIITKWAPLFYVANWVILIVVITPMVIFAFRSLREELTYLFSIYLTIPRSILSKFIDGSGCKGQDKKNGLAFFMSSSLAFNTGKEHEDERERANANVADGFKMLVNENTSHISVVPRAFLWEAMLIFIIVIVLVASVTTISAYLFVHYSGEIILCYHTQDIVSERSITASVLMEGITSAGTVFSPAAVSDALETVTELHTAILFKDETMLVSKSAMESERVASIQNDNPCNDTQLHKCKSLVTLFEYFTNEASNISSLLKENTFDPNIDTFNALRRVYNDELFERMMSTQVALYEYTRDRISTIQTMLIVILVVTVVLMFVLFVTLVNRVTEELTLTVESVKLPLKHIPPMMIPDLPKILTYLQGESDWGRHNQGEKDTDTQSGSKILNVMSNPFAIFEGDLALLFANASFYSLLNTSREASIGLQLDDIFASVMPIKTRADHPFNSILKKVTELQNGNTDSYSLEIQTELQIRGYPPRPIEVRLVGITGNELAPGAQKKLKANSFAIFLNDLSGKRALEEKIIYETDLSQKLTDAVLSRSLAAVLWNDEHFRPKSFEKIPIATFTITCSLSDDEFDDDLIASCGLFMRTVSDISQNFSSVGKLMEDAPTWIYISGYGSHKDDLDFATGELAHFALSVLEVFQARKSSATCELSASLHVGPITILPVEMDLPVIEAIGEGFTTIRNLKNSGRAGQLLVTPEASEILAEQKGLYIARAGDIPSDDGTLQTMFQAQRENHTQ